MLRNITQELCPPEINSLASLDEAREFSQFGIDAIGIQREDRSRSTGPRKHLARFETVLDNGRLSKKKSAKYTPVSTKRLQ